MPAPLNDHLDFVGDSDNVGLLAKYLFMLSLDLMVLSVLANKNDPSNAAISLVSGVDF